MNTTTNAILRTGLLSAVAGLALMSAAMANTTPLQTYTLPLSTTELGQGFTFTQFDPTLGTLDSATLTLDGSGLFSGTVQNNAAQAQTFKVTESSDITLSGPAFVTPLTGNVSASQNYTLLAAGVPSAFGPQNPTLAPISQTYTSGLGGFIGTGTLPFSISTLTGQTIAGGGGNIATNLSTKAGADATLVYTYHTNTTTVPEPGAWASMSIGAMGLMFLGFKARKKNLQF